MTIYRTSKTETPYFVHIFVNIDGLKKIFHWHLLFRGVATGVYTPPNQSTVNFLCGCFVSLTHLNPPKSNSWLRLWCCCYLEVGNLQQREH